MEKTIDQMVDEATGYLEANRYAEETKREYQRAWGKFEGWCRDHETTCPDDTSVAAFVEEMGWKDAPGKSFGGKNRRCVQVLVEYGRTGVWRKKCCRLSSGPPECELALADYIRNERPPVDDPHVFVVPKAPYGPYVEHNTFHHVISRLLSPTISR